MKVIKKWKEITGTTRVTCKTCEAKLEIQARDLKKRIGDDNSPTIYCYQCPCCHRKNYLHYIDLTEEILFDLNIKD